MLIPESIPDFFRSGMNATINFIERSKEDILLLPVEAVYRNKDGNDRVIDSESIKHIDSSPDEQGKSG